MPKSIYSEPNRVLCALLTEKRKALGLSQYALAKRLNRPQSFVAKIEGGERRIDVVEFLDIAHALEADPHELLREVEMAYRAGRKNNEYNASD